MLDAVIGALVGYCLGSFLLLSYYRWCDGFWAFPWMQKLELTMLEVVRTFWGKVRGLRGERRTVVEEGQLWRCTECKLIFVSKSAGEEHDCKERL